MAGRRRARAADVLPQIRCALRACRSKKECKNTRFTLPADMTDRSQCRPMRTHAKVLRFCSDKHMAQVEKEAKKKKTKKEKGAKGKRGREPLNIQQIVCLFHVLNDALSAPWAAVLLLLQLHMGDRIDCSRQVCASWLVNLDSTTGLPSVDIRKVNEKTTPRAVPLPERFAQLLWQWISDEPLKSSSGNAQWPWSGQELHSAIVQRKPCFLFPGRVNGGLPCRDFKKAHQQAGFRGETQGRRPAHRAGTGARPHEPGGPLL